MWKIAINGMRACCKQYVAIIVIVLFSVLFILTAGSIYSSYCDIQIENAYLYNGHWDLKTVSENQSDIPGATYIGSTENTYTALLDEIDDSDLIGTSAAYADHYLLSIVGLNKEDADLTSVSLVNGHMPENNLEIVLPDSFSYDGKSLEDGTLGIGDTITLQVGIRKDENTNIIQSESIESGETIQEISDLTYTITGFYEDDNYTSGTYVKNGYTGKSDCEVCSYYFTLNQKTSDSFADMSQYLTENFDEAYINNFVANAVISTFETDYMKSIENGVIIFQILIVIIALTTISFNLIRILVADKDKIHQFHTIGATGLQIKILYFIRLFLAESIGYTCGLLLSVVLLLCLKEYLLSLLNSGISDFNIINYDLLVTSGTYIVILLVTAIALSVQIDKAIRKIRLRKPNSKKAKYQINSLMSLSLRNIKLSKIKSIVMIGSISMIIVVTSIVGVLYPAIKEKSKESTDVTNVTGDFSVVSYELTNKYDSYLESMLYVDTIYKSSGAFAKFSTANGDNYSCTVLMLDEDYYNAYKSENDTMLDYDEFQKSDKCYVFDTYYSTTDSQYHRSSSIEKDNNLLISGYSQINGEFNINVDSVLGRIPGGILDDVESIDIIIPDKIFASYFNQDISTVYKIFVDKGKTSEVGENLTSFTQKNNLFLQDNAKELGSSEDNNNIQMLALIVISILFIAIGTMGMITIIRIDSAAGKDNYILYRTLGLDRKNSFLLQFFEYVLLSIDALLLSLVVIIALILFVFGDIYEYYAVKASDCSGICVMVFFIIEVILVIFSLIISGKRYRSTNVVRKRIE